MFLFAAPWSPPAWMKTNGALAGGSLKDGCEEAAARYVLAYVMACRARGIDLGAVNVQNEPFWGGPIYPTCTYSMEQLSRATISLCRLLRESKCGTKVWYWDHNYSDAERVGAALEDPTLLSAIGGVAWHSYEPGAEDMGALHRRHPDIPFYHTEQGPAIVSPERTERWWCDRLFDAFENGCRSFTAWNLCLSPDGQPLTGPHTCAGLLSVDPEAGDVAPSALYRVFRHVGPFVKRGARLLHADGDRDGAATTLWRNPDGGHVLVIGCSGRAEGREGPPRARVHVKWRGEWLAVPLPPGFHPPAAPGSAGILPAKRCGDDALVVAGRGLKPALPGRLAPPPHHPTPCPPRQWNHIRLRCFTDCPKSKTLDFSISFGPH